MTNLVVSAVVWFLAVPSTTYSAWLVTDIVPDAGGHVVDYEIDDGMGDSSWDKKGAEVEGSDIKA